MTGTSFSQGSLVEIRYDKFLRMVGHVVARFIRLVVVATNDVSANIKAVVMNE